MEAVSFWVGKGRPHNTHTHTHTQNEREKKSIKHLLDVTMSIDFK